jgi:hypothetical protein
MISNIHKHIVDILAKQYGKDKRVINEIVSYPFKFIREVAQTDHDRPIRFPILGLFYLKNKLIKKMRCRGKIERLKAKYPDNYEIHNEVEMLYELGKYTMATDRCVFYTKLWITEQKRLKRLELINTNSNEVI